MIMLVFIHNEGHIADESTKCIEVGSKLDYLVKHGAWTLVDGFAHRLQDIGCELVFANIETRSVSLVLLL